MLLIMSLNSLNMVSTAPVMNCASKGIFISGSGVRSIWQRHDLENFHKPLKAHAEKGEKEGISP